MKCKYYDENFRMGSQIITICHLDNYPDFQKCCRVGNCKEFEEENETYMDDHNEPQRNFED